MKSVCFLSLLLLVWLAPSSQAGADCPPIQPSDTVNHLPVGKNSRKLKKLFRLAQASQQPIRFTQYEETGANKQADTCPSSTENVIALGHFDSTEHRESLIAHELFHIVLKNEHIDVMPAVDTSIVGLSGNNHVFFGTVATDISSCVIHGLLDKRMARLGFKPDVLLRHQSEALLHPHVLPEIANGRGFQMLAGLRLFCFLAEVKSLPAKASATIPVSAIKAGAYNLNPLILANEQKLEDDVGSLDCDSSESCFRKALAIRDATGYVNEVKIQDPNSKEFK
jgi:hypothetical protein